MRGKKTTEERSSQAGATRKRGRPAARRSAVKLDGNPAARVAASITKEILKEAGVSEGEFSGAVSAAVKLFRWAVKG